MDRIWGLTDREEMEGKGPRLSRIAGEIPLCATPYWNPLILKHCHTGYNHGDENDSQHPDGCKPRHI